MPNADESPQVPESRVAAALARLREQGERVTPARRAVLAVVDRADRADEHLTADEICARVAELEPTVHRATVYRTLTSLTEAAELSHVHVGGAATVYHLATHAGPRSADQASPAAYRIDLAVGSHAHPGSSSQAAGHVHLKCVSCGRVLDAPPRVLDAAAARLRDALGFELDTTHAALLGRCADCVSPRP